MLFLVCLLVKGQGSTVILFPNNLSEDNLRLQIQSTLLRVLK